MAAFRVFLIALALTAPVWTLNATSVQACSCGVNLPSMVAAADLIILGTAIDVSLLDADGDEKDQIARALVESTVIVDTYLLGSGPNRLQVRSTAGVYVSDGTPTIRFGLGPSCDYAPELNARNLFFIGREEDGSYQTGGCAAFLDGEYVQVKLLPDIRQLLQEPAPQPTVLPEVGMGIASQDSSLGWQVTAAAGVLIAASASAALVALRRRVS